MAIPALQLIDQIAATRARINDDPDRHTALAQLQQWQVARLRATYADYYCLDRYRGALDFFVDDLYGAHDFPERDRDLRRVMQMWHRLLPQRGMQAITHALELEALSQDLDLALLDHLSAGAITPTSYAQAYRLCNRRADRERQIWLILAAGRSLDQLIAQAWVRPALRAARTPARLAGVQALQVFLERGYAAFARMAGSKELLHAIERRESAIMQRLLTGAADPFDIRRERLEARGS